MNPVGTSEFVMPRGKLWSKINRKKTFPLNYTLMVFCLCQNIAYKQKLHSTFLKKQPLRDILLKKNFLSYQRILTFSCSKRTVQSVRQ